jgi:cell division protein ZapA (FtsZ GTPase activity inhibitor)
LISDYGRDVQALINNFFPWIDGRDMQAIVQAINDEVTKLVGSNPAPGALVGALLAILAVNVYDCLDTSREEIGKLKGALNGTLNPIDQQKLKKELEQQGTEILNLSKSISEQYF